MALYYVNRNAKLQGDHLVHHADCIHLPDLPDRMYLGYFDHTRAALTQARQHYTHVAACPTCSKTTQPRPGEQEGG